MWNNLALWRTYPPNTNYGLLSSHAKAPILDLQWSLSSSLIYSVSADHTLHFADVTTGQRIRKIRAHREIINSLDRTMATGSGVELLATGSDDGTVKIWEGGDEAGKLPVATFDVGCPVTSVCWGLDGNSVYIGAIDNKIHVIFSSSLPLPYKYLIMQFWHHFFLYTIGLRPPQKRASVYTYRSHRYPNLSSSVTQRKLSVISLVLVTNDCMGYTTLLAYSITDTSCTPGRTSWFRTNPIERFME